MRIVKLIAAMDRLDKAGIWAYLTNTLRLLFPENERAMLKALARHEKAGLIVRVARGLYVNPRARSLPADALSALVPFLRPWDFNYLSLESALSEAGWISQIPSRLTVMTTGRSQTFETPYGTLEFVHTAQRPDKLRGDLVFDTRRELAVATPARALRDLKRVGRNLDLVVLDGNQNVPAHTY
jgi:predicted transcriptional regulator of viral defense system